jgi:uncharacterized protein
MVQIGKYNQLKVVKKTNKGVYFASGEREIFLSSNNFTDKDNIEDEMNVFVYSDSDNNLLATTKKPYLQVGEFALLTVKDIKDFGAFLDWGIDKDILVPNREQKVPMKISYHYIVHLYIDEATGRITASSRWTDYIDYEQNSLKENDEVNLLIADKSDLGYNAIINNKYVGLIYSNEIFEPIKPGDRRLGYVKTKREDGKIDLSLQPKGYKHVENSKDKIIEILNRNDGYLSINDNSSPEEIYQKLQMSKKAFKKTIGGLFKERLIEITTDGIKLLKQTKSK